MTQARSTRRRHFDDGRALLRQLDELTNPSVCALCTRETDRPLCDACDKQLRAELRRGRRRAS